MASSISSTIAFALYSVFRQSLDVVDRHGGPNDATITGYQKLPNCSALLVNVPGVEAVTEVLAGVLSWISRSS